MVATSVEDGEDVFGDLFGADGIASDTVSTVLVSEDNLCRIADPAGLDELQLDREEQSEDEARLLSEGVTAAGGVLPRSNPYVGSFHRGSAVKRRRPDEECEEDSNDYTIKHTHNGDFLLPRNNPYVGSFHRGGTEKQKNKQTKQTRTTSEDFAPQFLPIGMMMTAVTRAKESQRNATRPSPARKAVRRAVIF